MAEETKSKKEKIITVILNGLAILAIGVALTGWLSPGLGVVLIGAAIVYWLWEILTLKIIADRLSASKRLLMGLGLIIVLSLLLVPLAVRKIRSEAPKPLITDVKTPSVSEIADELAKRLENKSQAGTEKNKQPTPRASIPRAKEPFAVEIENSALMSDSREWPTGFWIEYRSGYGNTISPANLVLFLRFVNLQSVDTHIDSYRVELKTNNEWIGLARLPTEGTIVYNAYPAPDHPTMDAALSVARRGDFVDTGLENQLSKTNALLKPRDMVRGWALYEYPPNLQHVTGQELMRITVTDVKGVTASHIHDRKSEEQPNRNRALGQLFKVPPGGFEDISRLYRKHWTD